MLAGLLTHGLDVVPIVSLYTIQDWPRLYGVIGLSYLLISGSCIIATLFYHFKEAEMQVLMLCESTCIYASDKHLIARCSVFNMAGLKILIIAIYDTSNFMYTFLIHVVHDALFLVA